MADQESTEATVNEETQDTDFEKALDEDDTSFEDFDDDETEESESDEQNEDDADTDQQDDEEESEADADDQEDTEESQEDAESNDVEPSEEEKRKEHNRQMAERRIAEKQQREQSLAESQQEYLAAADDEKDAALRQVQIDMYNNNVEKHTNNLTNAYERAIKDFDILRDQSPEIQKELNDALDSFQAKYMALDKLGNPTAVREDLYTFLQNKADSIQQLTAIGKRNQAKSKSVEKSKTFTRPVTAPKQPKSDPDIDGFDEEANRW